MNFDKKILFGFLLLCFGISIQAQESNRFTARALVGFNAAQIRGDDLAGYDFFGLNAGVQVTYPIGEKWDLGIELLYSQKGSQREMSFSGADDLLKTNLQYLEVPLMLMVKDWYIEEEKYHKVKAHFGMSVARLFNSTSKNPLYSDNIGDFKKNDFAIIFGVSYGFTSKIEATARYSNSIFKFYEDESLPAEGLINYLWSITCSYRL
jgi:opacity protein-like surface antigen